MWWRLLCGNTDLLRQQNLNAIPSQGQYEMGMARKALQRHGGACHEHSHDPRTQHNAIP